ncbi:MAG: hypothetical protein KDD66_11390 [Bdellovibrionales bacterium]|nr:hypothetical protein [Bdellovibrionales bacterium]
MQKLELHFSSGANAQLRKTVFSHSSFLKPLVSVRGKSTGAADAQGCFQWTRAVQSFSLLALGFKIEGGALEGAASTPAASLDYAISKQTGWLADMFGAFESGAPIYKRIFKRSNPERKQPGPVIVAINELFLSPESVRIYVAGQEVEKAEMLQALHAAIKLQWYASARIRIENHDCRRRSDIAESSQDNSDSIKQLFHKLLIEECRLVLNATDIFNSRELRSNLADLGSNPSVRGLSGDAQLVSPIDQRMLSSHRLGLVDEDFLRRHLADTRPIRIASPAPGPAAAAIFVYLRDVKGYSIELDFCYPHAIEIAQRIIRGDFNRAPDAAVLGIAPAAQILGIGGKIGYKPLMMLPKNSQRIISGGRPSKRGSSLENSDYYLLKDDPSNPMFYFDQLVRSGEVRQGKVSLQHMEPDEVFRTFKDADRSVKAILFFPHYHLNELFNGTGFADRSGDNRQFKEMFLFVQDWIMRDKMKALCLDIAIRDAWLSIREQPKLMNQLIGRLVGDDLYLKYMRRASGLGSWSELSGVRGARIPELTSQ